MWKTNQAKCVTMTVLVLALESGVGSQTWGASIMRWGCFAGNEAPPAGNDFIAIAAGNSHGLALRSDGSIIAWGFNGQGQCDFPAGNDFTAVAGGQGHSIALKADGSIVGWGWNDYGQASPPPGNDFVAIAAGYYHSLALRSNGSIVAWGYNGQGQATPPSGTGFAKISAGRHHSLALKSDGSIVVWGIPSTPVYGSDFTAIDAGQHYSIALKSNGSIVGWGLDEYGAKTPPLGNDFTAISAGLSFALALRSDGSIAAWGDNSCAQINPPVGNNFVDVAAGGFFGLALLESEPPKPPGVTIRGTVLDAISRQPIVGANVIVNGDLRLSDTTEPNGSYVIGTLPDASINVTASKAGCIPESQTLPYSIASVADWHDSPYFSSAERTKEFDLGGLCDDVYPERQNFRLFLVPEGEEIHDCMSFRPARNGFHFINRGDAESPGGYCMGMSLMAVNLWLTGELPNRKAHNTEDVSGWPLDPDDQVTDIKKLQKDNEWAMDMRAWFWEIYVNVEELCRNLDQGRPLALVLATWTGPFVKAHQVVAYKVLKQPTRCFIWVYDGNYPEQERRIELIKEGEQWRMGSDSYEGYLLAKAVPYRSSYKPPLEVVAYSPVVLKITDPDGFVSSENLNEIDWASYQKIDADGDGEEDELLTIFWPKEGSYSIYVIPKPNALPIDTYSLEVITNGETITLAQDAAIQDIAHQPYIIRLAEDEIVPIFPAIIDFEPDTVNLAAPRKVVTVYIEMPNGFEVSQVEVSSVTLDDSISVLAKPTEIGDQDEDGKPDLMIKFDAQAVRQLLAVGSQTVRVNGRLTDGTLFAGIDTIRVIDASIAESVESYDIEEVVAFLLFEAGELMDQLGPQDLANEDAAFELACAMEAVFGMCEDGLYAQAMAVLDSDILQRMDGCVNTGEPDEDDWITSVEGQALLYPLVMETLEFLDRLIQ